MIPSSRFRWSEVAFLPAEEGAPPSWGGIGAPSLFDAGAR